MSERGYTKESVEKALGDLEVQLLEKDKRIADLQAGLRIDRMEYWHFQGDEEDHLESLNCPVVIHPKALMEIIAERDELRKECDRLTSIPVRLEEVGYTVKGPMSQACNLIRDIEAAVAKCAEKGDD